jgi:hypothetical protein
VAEHDEPGPRLGSATVSTAHDSGRFPIGCRQGHSGAATSPTLQSSSVPSSSGRSGTALA